MKIQRIKASETIGLRNAILRPGRSALTCIFDGDELTSTAHFGAIKNDQLVGIVSIYFRDCEKINLDHGYQVRAMATCEEMRGQGIGLKLLKVAEDFAFKKGAKYIWANARVSVKGFYEKAGFNVDTKEFDIEDVGAHVLVFRKKE